MKEYTKLVKSLLKELGYSDVKVRVANAMCADMENQTIYLNNEWFVSGIENDSKKAVKQVYKDYGWKIGVSMGTFGILHELGHCVSYDSYDDYESVYMNYIHKQNKIASQKLNAYQTMKLYRNIKLEKDADLNAYAIYKANTKLIKEYDKKLIKLLVR
jgi:hypothetical protein